MDGYMYMARNISGSHGVCGINMLASYPIKTKPNRQPTPTPKPIKCNLFSWCNEGETCCCATKVLGIWFKWMCCLCLMLTVCQIALAENASFEGILGSGTTKAMMERFKRGKIREKRRKDREMERRLKAKDEAVGKMSKINKDRDHEISEIVALCTYHDKVYALFH
ncbi:xylem bark cysteine peptidase 3 [Artemisia annua]|uniref:Xylem bark cysteine peptidase 3 n=1 Tax=Artemisia annua TaxID=35608 RepID=A0A2U1Q7E6_ARTAN|nr:xylem bark cysteine peptidase 3 [Artemisia annua]